MKRVRSGLRPDAEKGCKKEVLPTPGSLSAQMLPPIISTSRLLIDNPRPVPPNLRVVDVSA